MRTTKAHLESLVTRLNEVTGNPLETYSKDDTGHFKANIGNYHIYEAYGGVQLHRMVNDDGGIRVMSENGCTTKHDLYTQIQMLLKGIEGLL
jgi:hypothetical protein